MPKPAQPGGVPVWVSGRSTNARVVERVVRFGAGWIPWGDDAQDPLAGLDRMRAALDAAGRDPASLQVTAALPADVDEVPALAAAGITDFRIAQRVDDDDLHALVAAFRAVAGREPRQPGTAT
jgi:alkanesulfonate monooxygenase SsuD/methylene tetrahydromethanopterin reductase-like flavin-dependent oxidoreductase (luciferase family)